MTRLNVSTLALALSLTLGSSTAGAATISFSGAFVSYSGAIGGCGAFETFINGANVTPATGCDPVSSTVDQSFALAGTPGVTFYGTQFGTELTRNGLLFQGAENVAIDAVGEEVLLGTLYYTNGTWFGSQATFGLRITSSSNDGRFDGHTLSDNIFLQVTPTVLTGTPEQNADFVYLQNFSTLGSLRVYESFDSPTGSNLGWVNVYGRIGSIVPTRFAEVQGAGFLDPGTAIAPTPTGVPEPGTVTLLGSGVILLALRRRRSQPAENRE
jgi:hypothetical protein